MKQALITGGGSKFGRHLSHQLINAGYHVTIVTGSTPDLNPDKITCIPVNWHSLSLSDLKTVTSKLCDLDLIFFNHNASSLSQAKFQRNQIQSHNSWAQSYFVACQFPFYLIHTLSSKIKPTTKVCWMLSELIKNPIDAQVGYADYIGNKFTNACIMRSFSLNYNGCFFGIHPDDGLSTDAESKARSIISLIDNKDVLDLNGNIYNTQGERLVLTNLT